MLGSSWITPEETVEKILAVNSLEEAIKKVKREIFTYGQIADRYLMHGAPSDYAQEWIDAAWPYSQKVLKLLEDRASGGV